MAAGRSSTPRDASINRSLVAAFREGMGFGFRFRFPAAGKSAVILPRAGPPHQHALTDAGRAPKAKRRLILNGWMVNHPFSHFDVIGVCHPEHLRGPSRGTYNSRRDHNF